MPPDMRDRTEATATTPGIRAILGAVAVVAITVPAIVVHYAPLPAAKPVIVTASKRVVPQAELPPVEPVTFVDLAPDDARSFNATVPFSTAPNPAARPFVLPGGQEDRDRATDCLAAAVWYEAGDDAVGERAVAQVVLNRVRHPAFPKTVCGVVFEGSDRTTGCQFTFTCDGAILRKPSDSGWQRARGISAAALSGAVYKPVGYATHYHTDWVVPYWQSSLDKVTAVHTHLFFRWTGWWGTPPAFNRQVQAVEPVVAKIAMLSDAHRLGTVIAAADASIVAATPFFGRALQPLVSDPNTFLTTLAPTTTPQEYRALAEQACGDRPKCKVLGWTDVATMASTLPLEPEQMTAMSFSYLRDRPAGFEKALWNCGEFKGLAPRDCMKRQVMRIAAPAEVAPMPEATRGPEVLDGVRRKTVDTAAVPAPAITPTPTPKRP